MEGGYDSAVDEDRQPYYMKLLNKNNLEVAQLKCYELQPLKNIKDIIVRISVSPSNQLCLTYVARHKATTGEPWTASDDRAS